MGPRRIEEVVLAQTQTAALAAKPTAAPLAFDEVYRLYAPSVVRWVSRLGGPGIDLEDAVQEVFAIVDRRLAEFVPDAKLTTWLFRITMNVVRHERRKRRLWRWLRGSAEDVAGRVSSPEPSPLDDAERRSAREQVYRILDGMNERYRTVLILSELEGLGTEELAERLGVSRENLWVLLHRARANFVRRLTRVEREEAEAHHG